MTENTPPLYQQPVPLRADEHAGWQLQPTDMAFASDCNAVPVVLEEFAIASRDYPILFVGEAQMPVAVLGLRGGNRFVSDGQWATGRYVPAYVRRYPFVMIELDDAPTEAPQALLAIDQAAPHISREPVEGGTPLFVDGAPGEHVQNAVVFCQHLSAGHLATTHMVQALRQHELLVPRQADVQLPNRAPHSLQGFHVVDAPRLDALDDATLADWHRRGWLAALQFHLASLQQFDALLQLEITQEA